MNEQFQYERDVLEDFLIEGLIDWNHVGWAVGLALGDGAEPGRAANRYAVGLLAELFVRGLAVPGRIENGKFDPWEGRPDDWLRRILAEWKDGRDLTPGEIAWIKNTSLGDEFAREAKAERERIGYTWKASFEK